MSVSTYLVPSAKTVNVKATKTNAKNAKSTLSCAYQMRELIATIANGNGIATMRIINADNMRPIKVIEFIMRRALTDAEISAYWNQCEEFAPPEIRKAVAISRRWQAVSATCRRIVRESRINAADDDDVTQVLRDLKKFADTLEVYGGK